MSQAGVITTASGIGAVTTLTGNTGGAVGPSGGNINVVGDGTTIEVTGNPGTSTLTISALGGVATTFDGDTGSASPSAGVLTLHGTGDITTSATGSTVTFAGSGATTFDATTGSATTSSNTITFVGSGDVSTSATSHTVTIAGSGVTTVDTGSGTATASSNTMTIAGGTGITTSASGSTVTITATGGTGTVTSISAGTGITLTPSPITSTGTVALTVPVTVANGGTGDTTLTAYAVLCGGTTSTGAVQSIASLGSSGNVLTSNGAGALPTFQAAASGIVTIDGDSGSMTGSTVTISGGTTGLTTSASSATMDLTGTLKLANGGTNASLTANNGGIFYSTATAGAILSGTATADQVLLSGSSTAPAWSTATYPATTTINQLLYSSASNTIGGVTAGDYGVLISSSSGVPSWLANGTTGQVLTATTSGTPSWEAASASSITITGDSGGGLTGNSFTFTGGTTGLTFAGSGTTETLGGALKLANGGTNASLTANNGGIFYSTASAGAILAGTATADQVLLSGSSTSPAWSTATYPATTTINQLLYSSANNAIGGVTAGDYGVLISSSSGVPSWLANGTTGQVLTATTSGTPSWEAAGSGGITTLDGNSGSATGSTVTITTGASNANGTANFTGSSATLTLAFNDANGNSGLGASSFSSGSFSSLYSTAHGYLAGENLTTGNTETLIGAFAGQYLTSGTQNTFIGGNAGRGSSSTPMTSPQNTACGGGALGALTTGSGNNVGIGISAGDGLLTGAYNTIIGSLAGLNYVGSESSNIQIGYNNNGTASENHVLRIGNGTGSSTAGNLNSAFISGITGITVTGTAALISTGNQLGVAASSRRFKNDIQDMGDSSACIYSLRPVSFVWNKESSPGLKDAPDLRQYGLIAEEAVSVIPHAVNKDKDGIPFNINYTDLIGMLVNEVQKLRKEVDALKGAR